MNQLSLGVRVLLGVTLVRLLVAAIVPLHPDEAYYWEWSRHLAPGYFDHPPAIAVVIRGGTLLLGDTTLGVRLLPVLLGLAGGWAVMRTAHLLGGDAAADGAAIAMAALPVMSGTFLLATPDAPLLAAAAVTLWATTLAVRAGSRAQATGWWVAAGLAAGAALLAKYTAIVLPGGILVAVVASRSLRRTLATPGPWLAVLVMAVCFLPVIRWNAAHDWSSFRFQVAHGLGSPINLGAIARELELIGGQVLLASPILFVLGVSAMMLSLRADEPARRVLAAVALFTASLFAYSALRRRVEANWPAIAWIPIATLLGTSAYAAASRPWRRAGIGVGFLFTAALYLQSATGLFPVPVRRDPTVKAYGWQDLADVVAHAASAQATPPWIAANRYQDAAELAFHLPGHPRVSSLNVGARDNQYQYWPGFPELAKVGDNLLLVLPELPEVGTPAPILMLAPLFDAVEEGEVAVMLRDGKVVSRRRLWLLRRWHGAWLSPPRIESAPQR